MTKLQQIGLESKANAFVFDIAKEYAEKMNLIGVPVQFDKVCDVLLYPTNKTHARCYYKNENGGMYLIVIDNRFARHFGNAVVREHIVDSICHELLHTCNGCMEHNDLWIKWANKCDVELGTHTMQYLEDSIYFDENKTNVVSHICPFCGFEYVATGKRNIKCQCCNGKMMVATKS